MEKNHEIFSKIAIDGKGGMATRLENHMVYRSAMKMSDHWTRKTASINIQKILSFIFKIMGTILFSLMIIAGLAGFFPLVIRSSNLLLEVIIPLTFYLGFCYFSLYAMWKPLRGFGVK